MTHKFFGFDFFFLLKSISLSVWKTKNLNIGGSNFANENFANLGNQVKLSDMPKYYQQSLVQLTDTIAPEGNV